MPLSGKRPCKWAYQIPTATVGVGFPSPEWGVCLDAPWPMVRAVVLPCVAPRNRDRGSIGTTYPGKGRECGEARIGKTGSQGHYVGRGQWAPLLWEGKGSRKNKGTWREANRHCQGSVLCPPPMRAMRLVCVDPPVRAEPPSTPVCLV